MQVVPRFQAGLRGVGFRGDADLGEAPAVHQPAEELRHVPAVARHRFLLQLIPQHHRLVGEDIQHRVKLGEEGKIARVEAALPRCGEDLPVQGAGLLQEDRGGPLGGHRRREAVRDVLLAVLAPEVDQDQLPGGNAAGLHDPGNGPFVHTLTFL